MKQKKISTIRKFMTISLISVTGLMMFGQACSQFRPGLSKGLGSLSSSSILGDSLPKDFAPKADTQTVSMAYSRQILDTMLSCSGIGLADDKIRNEYETRKGSLSEFGYATQVSSAMLMSITAVSGEICNKLIAKESGTAIPNRRIFNNINFSGKYQDLKALDIEDATKRLARSCWQREPASDEIAIITQNLQTAFQSDTSSTGVSKSMLVLCTGMLSSLSSISM
jgi:hypothetical protein